MEGDHLQRGILHLRVRSADQILKNDDAIIPIAGVERGVEHAAVGEPAIEDDPAYTHVLEEEIEVGGIEHRQSLLGVHDDVLGSTRVRSSVHFVPSIAC